MFVRPALSGDEFIRPNYKVQESYEPKAKKTKQTWGASIVLSDGYSAIDFLNTIHQVFQATTCMGADHHDMKGWVHLLLDAQIIFLDNNGTLKSNAQPKTLNFYRVVPKQQRGWASRKGRKSRPKLSSRKNSST
jgi:hypothetical protein